MSAPNKTEIVPAEAQGGQTTDSVLDYLYYDSRRIASFLAQFDPSGHLQQIRQTETSGGEAKSGTKKSIGLTHGLKLDRQTVGEATEHESNAFERTYDPLWGNARAFMDYLSERGLIKRVLGNAGIGSIVLIKGSVSVIDLAVAARLWEMQSVKSQMRVARKKETDPSPGEFALDLISSLPHVIQVRMDQVGQKIWASLRPDGMVISSGDLMLKHGIKVAGKWSLLGVLDAMPDQGASSQFPTGDMTSQFAQHGLIPVVETLAPLARFLLGRPNDHFGVTPLLIFREVGS